MDRTSEFVKIIRSTHIPQRQTSPLVSPYARAFEIDAVVKRTLLELDKTLSKERIYEAFTLQSKIDKTRELVREMRESLKIELRCRNEQESASYNSLNGIIKNRIAKHLLKLTELIRKKDARAQVAEERRQKFDSVPQGEMQQDVVLLENEVTKERIQERQRISMQISEIGQIMEEISVHVSLQEESFKRIDDLMGTSDALISGSLELMKKTWENVANTRPAIVKFLLFWIVLSLIFWILRR